MRTIHPALPLAIVVLIACTFLPPGALSEPPDPADMEIGEPMKYVTFPHDLHREDVDCATCHSGSESPERETALASPETCLDCHEDSDIQPYFPLGAYHGGDYLHRHALDAGTDGRCANCHTDSETCAMCHFGEELDEAGHPRNWLFHHAIEARHQRSECSSCHSLETFCTDCHLLEGVSPGSHRGAGWTRGVIHGSEARRDPMYCAACHAGAEPVCLDCHRTP